MIRVLIADDQAIVRSGIAMILTAEDDIEIAAEAGDGVEAIAQAERHTPDVILMDIRMPRLDGLDALRALMRQAPPGRAPRVVMVTTFDDDAYVTRALRSGACGFILKDSGPRLLIEAVRAAVAGDSLISPSITVRLLRRLLPGTAPAPPAVRLSPRERDVAGLVARGLTNAEIASALTITAGTVKTHLGNIQGKLGARNRVEIAAWAWQSGLAAP
ncbi:response regulator [Streptomyces zingiberis]|uniref:Response regulator transcription factor n=1 Tax=Streptomyces zingiberis TaxID=2053010 RepID=A0ABX1BP89_9ACTN|nr:response regulator transcription factor [Streptomyces zingiberis]NJP99490.1 response regulator transcription factor [Streptomyces zingiberis]